MSRFKVKRLLGFLVICALAAGAAGYGGTVVYAENEGNIEQTADEETAEAEILEDNIEEVFEETQVSDAPDTLEDEEKKTVTIKITYYPTPSETADVEDKEFTVGEKLLPLLPEAKDSIRIPNGCGKGWKVVYEDNAENTVDDSTVVAENIKAVRIVLGAHTAQPVPVKPATCTQPGYEAGLQCSNCGTYTSDGKKIDVDPNNHDWALEGDWSFHEDYHYLRCKNGCGAENAEAPHTFEWHDDENSLRCICLFPKVDAHAHNAAEASETFKKVDASPATCGSAEITTEHWECTVEGCQNKYFKDENGTEPMAEEEFTGVPATGEHTWGEWKTVEGNKQERECTVCEATEMRQKPGSSNGSSGSHSSGSGSSNSGSSSETTVSASAASAAVSSSGNPQTNDTSNPGFWTVLSILSGIAVLAGVNFGKDKKKVHH